MLQCSEPLKVASLVYINSDETVVFLVNPVLCNRNKNRSTPEDLRFQADTTHR